MKRWVFKLTTVGIGMTAFVLLFNNAIALPSYSSLLWENLKRICEMGPRNPGSLGHLKLRQFLKMEGERWADSVEEHEFLYRGPERKQIPMYNIEFKFKGQSPGRPILLGAHYDTRPYADEDKDETVRMKPIIGANDGGSGVALLLSLARHLKTHRPKRSVEIVFFDGEDYGIKHSEHFFIGSNHHAEKLHEKNKSEWPFCVLVVDMVADKDLSIFKEVHSMKNAAWLTDLIFDLSEKLGLTQFVPKLRYAIRDDHLPFARLGVPSAVLIDFDYPHWHTQEDTLDKCSEESLFAVFKAVKKLVEIL